MVIQVRVPFHRIYPDMRAARLSLCPLSPATLPEVAEILTNSFYQVMSSTVDGQDNIFSTILTSNDGANILLCASRRLLSMLNRFKSIYCEGGDVTPPHPNMYHVSNIYISILCQ